MHAEGLVATPTWEKLKSRLTLQTDMLADAVREVLETDRALGAEALDTARRAVLRAQRSALLDLRRDGVVSEDVFEGLIAEVDSKLHDAYKSTPVEIEDKAPRLTDTENGSAR